MSAIQSSYAIRPEPSPPKWLQFNIDVSGITPEVVDELEGKLQERMDQLASESVGTVEKTRFGKVKRIYN